MLYWIDRGIAKWKFLYDIKTTELTQSRRYRRDARDTQRPQFVVNY